MNRLVQNSPFLRTLILLGICTAVIGNGGSQGSAPHCDLQYVQGLVANKEGGGLAEAAASTSFSQPIQLCVSPHPNGATGTLRAYEKNYPNRAYSISLDHLVPDPNSKAGKSAAGCGLPSVQAPPTGDTSGTPIAGSPNASTDDGGISTGANGTPAPPRTGQGAISTTSIPLLQNYQAQPITEAARIAVDGRQQAIVDSATAILKANARDAESDQQTLNQMYAKMPAPMLEHNLQRAQTELSSAVSDLESTTSSPNLSSGERARFRNIYMNARDKASLALDAVNREKTGDIQYGADSPFKSLMDPKGSNPLTQTAALASVFGTEQPSAATSNEALVNRTLMYNGLPADAKLLLKSKLKLVETPELKLPTGEIRRVPILHNGYILGGAATATDCSAFASAALPPEVRKGRLTTLDFLAIWLYNKTGKFPRPPIYPKDRLHLLQEVSAAFTAVDIYSGDLLQTGDLLVYRTFDDTTGHVFIVRRYDSRAMLADVLEASQSAGTLRERPFDLSLDPPSALRRITRPGMFGLRLRPTDNVACKYPDAAKASLNQGSAE